MIIPDGSCPGHAPPFDAPLPAGLAGRVLPATGVNWGAVAVIREVVNFIGLQGKANDILDLGQVYFSST